MDRACSRPLTVVRTGLAVLVALAVAGCAPAESELAKGEGQEGTPSFGGAAAFAAATVEGGGPCATGEAAVTFAAEGETFAFPILARAGEAVAVHLSGDPDLDTVLALYGPADAGGFYGATPVAADDDGGEGRLSRLAATTIAADGVYLVVAATWQGRYRGGATLHVTTDGEPGCVAAFPSQPCDDGDPCTTEVMTAAGCELLRIEACYADPLPICCVIGAADGGRLAWLDEAACAAEGGAAADAGLCVGGAEDPICCVSGDGAADAHALGWFAAADCEARGGVRGGNATCLLELGITRVVAEDEGEVCRCDLPGDGIRLDVTRAECEDRGGRCTYLPGGRAYGDDEAYESESTPSPWPGPARER